VYIEYRPALGDTASTPQVWAQTFRNSRVLGWRKRIAIRCSFELKLLRRYVPGGRILDAGCGFGEWVAYLNRIGYDAEGLDYSEELVGRLRNTYPRLRWTRGTTQAMPYPDGSFDGIISWGVIEHDPKGPEAQLREFARVLKDGGAAVITVPADTERMRTVSHLHFPDRGKECAFFQHFMTHAELREACNRAGLRTIEVGDIPENAPALLWPQWYLRGHRGLRLVNIVRRLMPTIPGMHGMIYAIVERSSGDRQSTMKAGA
jgi:SAM-dependent methyltransferase